MSLSILLRSAGLLLISFVAGALAADPWPGESWGNSTNLTHLNPLRWNSNLSGAYWNPHRQRLWVANNSGHFSVLSENGLDGFVVDTTFSPGGDLEGITQADVSADKVYLLVERENLIREYTASTGILTRTWSIGALVGGMKDPNDGVEGIAFIPDTWLAKSGFRDSSGALFPKSKHGTAGLGGIFLVAVQDIARSTAGYIYAVDLNTDGTWTTVGRYKTSRSESCGLAFDASIGRLYILHNVDGNLLEVTDLTSTPYNADRKFTTLREIQIPSTSNIEGFALSPALRNANMLGERWAFFADDDNLQGALRWFQNLPSTITRVANDSQTVSSGSTVPERPAVRVLDAYGNALRGFNVTFQITSGDGKLTGAMAVADSNGIAQVESWTLGSTGINTLKAYGPGLSGSPILFTADATAPVGMRDQRPIGTAHPQKPKIPSYYWLLGRVRLPTP